MSRRSADPFSGPLLWAMYASGLVILLTLSLLAATAGTGWSWPIFATGVAAGVAMVVLNHLTLRFAWARVVSRGHPTPERQARGRAELTRRQRIYPVVFTMALGFAVLSAALQRYWPIVVVLVVWVLLVVVLPLALLPTIMRRVERKA